MTALSTVIGKGTIGSRPAAGNPGRVYFSTEPKTYRDNGSSWDDVSDSSSGLSDPMTTRGDVIVRNASNVTARLGIGSAGQVLRTDGTDVSWGAEGFIGCRAYHSTTQSINSGGDTSINFDTEDFDTSAFHFTSAAALTGTVTKTASSTTITGAGTSFTTELSVNQMISIPGGGGTDIVVITAIGSNTSLTVAVAPTNSAAGQTATRFNQGIAIPAGLGGYYHVGARLYYAASNTTGVRWTGIFKNSAHLHGDGNIVLSSATDGVAGAISDVLSLVAGDYVYANAFQNSGGAINVGGASDYQRSVLWAYRVGV